MHTHRAKSMCNLPFQADTFLDRVQVDRGEIAQHGKTHQATYSDQSLLGQHDTAYNSDAPRIEIACCRQGRCHVDGA